MLKKSLLVITIMVSGILSCCTDVIPHFAINDFTIEFDDGNRNFVEEGTFTTDSLYLQTNLDVEFLSSVWERNPFINTALALSCEPDGNQGLKDKMTSITFTSNEDFNDIIAGSSLNSIVVLSNRDFLFVDTTLDGFISQMNRYYDFGFKMIEFVMTEKPTNQTSHEFTITMDFESGKTVEVTSKEITWE